MAFPDLTHIPAIDWSYDREFRVEPSGEIVKQKITKARDDAALEQQDELTCAIEELALCMPNEEDRRYRLLFAKCTKTNSLGKGSYSNDIVPVESHETALRDTYIVSSLGSKPQQADRHVTQEITVCHKRIEIAAYFDEQGETSKFREFFKHLEKYIALFNQEELTCTGIWNALKFTFPDKELIEGSGANISLKIDNQLFIANFGSSRALIIDHNAKTTLQLNKAQNDISLYELQPDTLYTLVQASKSVYEAMTSDHVGYFLHQRTEDLATKTEYLVRAALEDFAADGNIIVITRQLSGR